MSQTAHGRLTLDKFGAWQARQEVRCELIDGRPVAMTGATFAHDIVVSNLIRALGNQLAAVGSSCRAFTADIGFVTGPATLRRPDVSVYCPPFNSRATRSDKATLVADIGSPSTRAIDAVAKLDEYRSLLTLQAVLLVEPEQVDIGLWHLQPGGAWQHRPITDDLAAMLDIPCLGICIPLADIYNGVTLVPPKEQLIIWPGK